MERSNLYRLEGDLGNKYCIKKVKREEKHLSNMLRYKQLMLVDGFSCRMDDSDE